MGPGREASQEDQDRETNELMFSKALCSLMWADAPLQSSLSSSQIVSLPAYSTPASPNYLHLDHHLQEERTAES